MSDHPSLSPYPKLVRTPEALKEARQALGLSADGLARMLRVDDGRTVRRWEASGATIPGPVIVVMETAMSYLNKRVMIGHQLEMLRSGRMHTGTSNGHHMVDDTDSTIKHLEEADADYGGALKALMQVDDQVGNDLEALTRQPVASEPAREVHWYHLWRKTPKHEVGQKDDWSLPGEVSPEAALAYFEKHEGFSDGLTLCSDPDDPTAEFILEQREVLRTPRGNSVGLRAGRLVDSMSVRSGPDPDSAFDLPSEDARPFKTIRLNRLAPGSNGGFRRLGNLQTAVAYVNEHVPNAKRSDFWWLVAINALNFSARTGEGFEHARAALAEALRTEGWMGN